MEKSTYIQTQTWVPSFFFFFGFRWTGGLIDTILSSCQQKWKEWKNTYKIAEGLRRLVETGFTFWIEAPVQKQTARAALILY